ncbi:MFS transporter [Alloacidobacterium sp.]|uniref:MFS transporter n=1 Tax=Alloacidobacterium sp. TaxID=2951999 RepID=UPI002D4EC316|nr:MFS transporter [Alloacidobacterium sp.]HYK37462.1 MFS transporter [Alloacidobacterium sp.]
MPAVRRFPVRTLLVVWLFVLSAVAYMDRTNISIAGPAIRSELGIDNVHLGWVFSAFLVGYACFQVPGGWLADRFGSRRILGFGVLWWGVFTALTAAISPRLPHALLLLILVRVALGIGEAVIYPASNHFVARWIPVAERGKANGWIFAGVGAGAGLTLPLLNWIVQHFGWRASFWFCALIGVFVGTVWFLAARDTPEQHPFVSKEELAHIEAGRSLVLAKDSANAKALSWQASIFNRSVIAMTLSYFSFGYVAWIFFSWFFIYLAQVRKLDLKSSALYSMIPFLAMTVCCLAGGVISDWLTRRYGRRLGRCGIATVSLALTSIFLVLGPRTQSTQLASIILAGGAGALYISQSSFWSVTADISGKRSGMVSGLMNMGGQVGGAVTASLTPSIAARYGWNTAFFVAAAAVLAGGCLWLLVDPGEDRTAFGGARNSALADDFMSEKEATGAGG